jgi:Domain of unkown function (DUF1775)
VVRIWSRLLTVGAMAGLGLIALAGPALAHVEVSADRTTAGATDVTLRFHGEGENPSAGITAERVVLPAGIAPADVSPVRAPRGWRFTRGADGFTVAGTALKPGTDAVWSVKVAQLPAGATRLSFKTLETYGDGKISRWIEIQEPGQAEPDNPAPLLTLRPGPSTAPASTAAPATSATSAPAPGPATVRATAPAADTGGTSTWWIWIVAIVPVAAAAALVLARRRSGD